MGLSFDLLELMTLKLENEGITTSSNLVNFLTVKGLVVRG